MLKQLLVTRDRKAVNARKRWYFCLSLVFVVAVIPALARADETAPARDPNQPIDEAYTQKIHKYTTAPHFASPLVDYLPASKSVPTPEAVLGDIAGEIGRASCRERV